MITAGRRRPMSLGRRRERCARTWRSCRLDRGDPGSSRFAAGAAGSCRWRLADSGKGSVGAPSAGRSSRAAQRAEGVADEQARDPRASSISLTASWSSGWIWRRSSGAGPRRVAEHQSTSPPGVGGASDRERAARRRAGHHPINVAGRARLSPSQVVPRRLVIPCPWMQSEPSSRAAARRGGRRRALDRGRQGGRGKRAADRRGSPRPADRSRPNSAMPRSR